MKKILLIFVISFGLTQIIKAQNYTISSYIGDEDDYWSGGYIYDFLYPNNSLSSWYDLPFIGSFMGKQ